MNFFKNKYLFKFKNNHFFSNKFMFQYGIHLGGHIRLMKITNTSSLLGQRALNNIINIAFSSSESIKSFFLIKNLGFQRTVIYFINSTLNFRLCFKFSFNKFNRHIFFPIC